MIHDSCSYLSVLREVHKWHLIICGYRYCLRYVSHCCMSHRHCASYRYRSCLHCMSYHCCVSCCTKSFRCCMSYCCANCLTNRLNSCSNGSMMSCGSLKTTNCVCCWGGCRSNLSHCAKCSDGYMSCVSCCQCWHCDLSKTMCCHRDAGPHHCYLGSTMSVRHLKSDSLMSLSDLSRREPKSCGSNHYRCG